MTLRDGAAVVGLARAAAGIDVGPESGLKGSACAAARALAEARYGLGGPFRLPGGSLGPLSR